MCRRNNLWLGKLFKKAIWFANLLLRPIGKGKIPTYRILLTMTWSKRRILLLSSFYRLFRVMMANPQFYLFHFSVTQTMLLQCTYVQSNISLAFLKRVKIYSQRQIIKKHQEPSYLRPASYGPPTGCKKLVFFSLRKRCAGSRWNCPRPRTIYSRIVMFHFVPAQLARRVIHKAWGNRICPTHELR